MNRTMRTMLGGLAGLCCLLFVGIDILLFGLVPLHSPLLTALPLAGLLLGAAWAWWAPLGSRSTAGPTR